MAYLVSNGVSNWNNRNDEGIPLDNRQLGLLTNYGVSSPSANECNLRNRTTPTDQDEIISFMSETKSNVPTKLKPSRFYKPTTDNIMYGIRIDSMYRVTSDTSDEIIDDLPVVCNLTIKHPRDRRITENDVRICITRMLSALFCDDNTMRIGDLMKGIVVPTKE